MREILFGAFFPFRPALANYGNVSRLSLGYSGEYSTEVYVCVCVHILYANIRAGIQRRLQTIDVLKLSVATECGNVYFKAHTGLHQQQLGGWGR